MIHEEVGYLLNHYLLLYRNITIMSRKYIVQII